MKAAEGFEYGDEGQNNADANTTGQRCAKSSLIQRLQIHFGECLIVLRTEGFDNIIAFCKHVSEKLKLVEANDDDNSLLMLVEDAIGDHTEEAYSRAGLITAL